MESISSSNQKSSNSPRVSIVLSARNDDYGGNFLHRINTCLHVLAYHAQRYPGIFEIIVVEYNPPPEEKPLAAVLTTHSSPELPIRAITVPSEFHTALAQGSKNPFFEYVAKNIGIRRAHGEYVLSANPDIVFSGAMMDFLATGSLNSQHFYRATRHDVPGKSFHDNPPVPEIERRAPRVATRALTVRGVRYISMKRWLRWFIRRPYPRKLWICPLFNPLRDITWKLSPHDGIHVGAAGDFVMAHRDAWAKIHGFDQIPFNSFVDGYNLYMFVCAGLSQEILPYPIYHINHQTSNNVRMMTDIPAYYSATAKMWRTKVPYKIYPLNWGFPETQFPQTSL